MKFLQDLRYGFRIMFKSPGFTAISVLTLALGIGANTAIFSIVYGMMLKPVGFEDPGSLVYLHSANPSEGWDESDTSYPNYLDWKAQSDSFEHMGLWETRSYTLSGDSDRPERIIAVYSTASLLPTLGIEPVLGRLFTEAEEPVGKHQVAMLFDEFWRNKFGGAPDVIGQTITLDEQVFTIIGVLPPTVEKSWERAELWTPLGINLEDWPRGAGSFEIMGRLREGVSMKQAQSELIGIAARLEQEYPDSNAGWTVNVQTLMEDVLGEEGVMALYTLSAAVFFVLLIACANMANLLLARGNVRQKEVAIRSALGASKFRLVSQLLTECLILSLLGGAIGTLLAFWGVDALVAMLPEDVPRRDEIAVNETVLWYTLALSVLSPFIFGLIPAIATSSINLVQTIKDGSQSATGSSVKHRGRDVLVVTQIALALALVVSAGLMIKSFTKLRHVDPGFNTDNLLTLRVGLPSYKYETVEQRSQFFEQACREIALQPRVEHVAAVQTLPLSGSNSWTNVTIEGFDNPDAEHEIHFGRMIVTPGYFETMGIPILEGRDVTWLDTAESRRVVLVNRDIAETYWPNESALGRRLPWGSPDEDTVESDWMTVVGVVDNVKHGGLDAEVRPEVFEPIAQQSRSFMTVVARTTGDPMVSVAGVQNAIWHVDPNQAIYALRTMDEYLFEQLGSWDAFQRVLGVLAAIALFLAAVGLYGIMAYNVSKRTQEIGIRMALGAQMPDVLHLILRRSITLTIVGVVFGLGLAYALASLMQVIMYEVTPSDPLTYLVVIALLMVVSLLATYVPARRALGVDPMTALRYE